MSNRSLPYMPPGGSRGVNGNGHHKSSESNGAPSAAAETATEYEFHPLAEAYPLLSDIRIEELGDDIAEHGQRYAIIRFDGKILDGRNRYLACKKKGIVPRVKELPDGEDPAAWVHSANYHRRHQTPEELTALAEQRRAKVARMRQGGKSTREIADVVGVSESQVRRDIKLAGAPPGAPEAPQKRTKGKDGKQYPAKRKNGQTVSPDPTPTRGDAYEPPPQPGRNADGAVIKDCLGQVVPQRLRDIFAQTVLTKVAERLAAAANEIINARKQLSGAMAAWAIWVPPVVLDDLLKIAEGEGGLTVAAESVANNIPYCVCPHCKGDDTAETPCGHCMAGAGWWPKYQHDAEGGMAK